MVADRLFRQCDNDDGEISSRMNLSGHLGLTVCSSVLTTVCCLVVIVLGLWLDLVCGWFVVVHTHLYYFPLSLSLCRVSQPRRVATFCHSAPQKYPYLLTYLLTTLNPPPTNEIPATALPVLDVIGGHLSFCSSYIHTWNVISSNVKRRVEAAAIETLLNIIHNTIHTRVCRGGL